MSMMQIAIETYCAEIVSLNKKLEERDRKIAKLEREKEELQKQVDELKEKRQTLIDRVVKAETDVEYWDKKYTRDVEEWEKETYRRGCELIECRKKLDQISKDIATHSLCLFC